MIKIGIVGLGFVGEAIRYAYETLFTTVVVVDADPTKSTGTYADLLDCDAVFVCVPSPSKDSGECDTGILNSVLYMLRDYKNVIISKTTAPPQFYEKMQTVYPNLVHIPEFLTAANAREDYLKEETEIMKKMTKDFRIAFRIPEEELETIMESFDGTTLELYNHVKKLKGEHLENRKSMPKV